MLAFGPGHSAFRHQPGPQPRKFSRDRFEMLLRRKPVEDCRGIEPSREQMAVAVPLMANGISILWQHHRDAPALSRVAPPRSIQSGQPACLDPGGGYSTKDFPTRP